MVTAMRKLYQAILVWDIMACRVGLRCVLPYCKFS